jgi:hypothetical protein
MSISSNSLNLLQFKEFSYSHIVKDKGGKPDRKPYFIAYGLRNP